MKKLYRVALLAALGLGTATMAQAQEMLLGFNDAAGPSSAQNDYVIDLGTASQFTTTSTLNLSSDFSASTFNTAFSSDVNFLTDVAVGAVAGGGAPTKFYSTVGLGTSLNTASVGTAAADAASPAIGEYASSTSGGWSYWIAASPTLPGNNTAGSLENASVNPMENLSSGVVTENVFEAANSSTGRGATLSETEIGSLTIDLNTDSVTFTGIDAVPEPATYGLLAASGLLIVSLRRQFKPKSA